SVASRLVEPDDYAYRASIVAMTQGHFLTLSTAQADRLAGQLAGPGGPGVILQWVQLPDGRWISEKDPGYPFLAAPFQALGIIRLAPLCYGALGCLGLFFGARRWLGRYGGAAAVVLFCSSGAALLFAWRDYMPTFTAGRDHLQPRRGAAQPAVHAGPPDPGHSHAGARAGG